MADKKKFGKAIACMAGIAAVGAGIAYVVKSKMFTDEMEAHFSDDDEKASAEDMIDAAAGKAHAAVDTVKDGAESAADAAKDLWKKGEAMAENAAEAVSEKAGAVVSDVKEKAADATGAVKDKAEDIQKSLSE